MITAEVIQMMTRNHAVEDQGPMKENHVSHNLDLHNPIQKGPTLPSPHVLAHHMRTGKDQFRLRVVK